MRRSSHHATAYASFEPVFDESTPAPTPTTTPTMTRAASCTARVITVASGKGGVGKTNLVANSAIELGRRGHRVLVIDGDLGLSNLEIIFGVAPARSLAHVLRGDATVDEIVVKAAPNVHLLSAGSGLQQLAQLDGEQQRTLIAQLDAFASAYDLILIDAAAGIHANVLFFAAAAEDVVVVVTPEPTSFTDGYAFMKVMARAHRVQHFTVVVNEVPSAGEARQVFARLADAASGFLHVTLDYAGYVYADPLLARAVRDRRPVVDAFPDAPASRCIAELATHFERSPAGAPASDPVVRAPLFWRRIASQGAPATRNAPAFVVEEEV